jgi:hypothetical protein
MNLQDTLAKIRKLVALHNVGYRRRILQLLDEAERDVQRQREDVLIKNNVLVCPSCGANLDENGLLLEWVDYDHVNLMYVCGRIRPMNDEHKARLDRLYAALVAYKSENDGCSPSLRQMLTLTNYTSTFVVRRALDTLALQGRIEFVCNSQGQMRGIKIVGATWLAPKEE